MSEQSRTISGIDIENFNDEAWYGVAEAYFRSAHRIPDSDEVSPDRWYYYSARDALNGFGEYRFGSVISMHSKLWLRNRGDWMHFDFDANADQSELRLAKMHLDVTEASIHTDFQRRVATALTELGVLREIIR